MIISIAGIAIIALGAFIWLNRGFFSALLNLVCTVIAGAIAFSLWEPTSFMLLDSGQTFIRDSAWGLGLAIPFAVSLAILRVVVDITLRANAKLDVATDYAAGGILGAMAAAIVAGFVVNSVGYMRLEPSFLDAQPIRQTPSGIAREGGPFFPIDRWVGEFYGYTAQTTFHSDTPLGRYYPRLDEVPASLRMTDGDGAARNTMRLEDYSIVNRYIVEGVDGKTADLLTDKWRTKAGSGAQKAKDLDGNTLTSADLHGVTLKFAPGSYEAFGQFVTGNGPIRMLAEVDGKIEAYHPIAVCTKAEAMNEIKKKAIYGRFAFDTNGFSVASKGGDTDCTMSFEFLLPKNAKPYCITVRNQRRDLVGEPAKFPSISSRDSSIETGKILTKDPVGTGGGDPPLPADLDKKKMITVKYAPPGLAPTTPPPGFAVNDRMPFVLMEGSTDGLAVDKDNGNLVIEGEGKFDSLEIAKLGRTGLAKSLRVERFQTTDDVMLVQVDMNKDMQINMTLAAFQEANQDTDGPALIDKTGARYQAIGFVYEEAKGLTSVRYTPGRPIAGIKELPSISTSRRDQKISLIFRVTKNAAIQYMVVGEKTVVAEYAPAYPVHK